MFLGETSRAIRRVLPAPGILGPSILMDAGAAAVAGWRRGHMV